MAKPKRGRPPKYGQATKRYQVTLPPRIARIATKIGNGSLSGGIVTLVMADWLFKEKEKNRGNRNG